MKQFVIREKAALAVSLLVLVLPLALAGWYVFQKHRWAQDRLQELEPRYARMLGMEAHTEDLEKARNEAISAGDGITAKAAQEAQASLKAARERIDADTAAAFDVLRGEIDPLARQIMDKVTA